MERRGGEAVRVQADGTEGVEPAVLDRVYPVSAAGADDPVAVGVGRLRYRPGHRARAVPGEPVVRTAVRADRPDMPVPRHEVLDRGVLGKMQYLAGCWSHPSI